MKKATVVQILSFVFGFVLSLPAAASLAAGAAPGISLKPGTRGFCFSHRGGMKEHVENTMAAFVASYEAGFRGFETDVRMTKDGELVLMHDPDTSRLFPVKVRIEDLTLQEVKQLRTIEGNLPIPTLDELLAYFADKPGCYIEFEMKVYDRNVYSDDMLKVYCRKLHDKVLAARPEGSTYLFTCFGDHVLEAMRAVDSECDMLAITSHPTELDQVARCRRLGIRRLGSLATRTTREMVDKWHRAGLIVSVWPVDCVEDYWLARGLDVDGICLNRPDATLKWGAEHERPFADDIGMKDVTGHIRGQLTAGGWNPPVKRRLCELIEAHRGDPNAYAVFDFDNTLAIGDLTLTLLGHILDVEKMDSAAYWREYRRIQLEQGDNAAVAWRQTLIERYSPERRAQLAKEAFVAAKTHGRMERDPDVPDGRRGLVFPAETVELLRELRAAGIRVYVVSGSRRDILKIAAGGLSGYKLSEDFLFSASDGVVPGEKPAYIRSHIGLRHGGHEPILVMGDSIGDYEMLTEFKGAVSVLMRRDWANGKMEKLAASGKVLVQGRDETKGCFVPSDKSVYP